MDDIVAALARWVTDVVESLGYLGIGILAALENLVPPIPSELVLPLAGFLAGQGRFWLPAVVLAATAGSVIGALTLYALGRWLGEERLRRFIRRFGRFMLLEEADLDRAVAWFDRHGGTAVFIGRLAPLVRSGISIPAGVERMPVWRFIVYTAAGSAVWNGALAGLGWALGSQWERVSEYTQWLSYGVIGALIVAAGWFLWRRAGARVWDRRRSN